MSVQQGTQKRRTGGVGCSETFRCVMPMSRAEEHSQPWSDPFVAEVRRIREALFAESGYDLAELANRLRQEQTGSDRRIVTRSARRPGSV